MIQTIFQTVGQQYFKVDVHTTGESNLNMQDYLCLQFLPSVKGDSVLAAASDHKQLPLLKITMWDRFHEEIQKDAKQRKTAWQMKQKQSMGAC